MLHTKNTTSPGNMPKKGKPKGGGQSKKSQQRAQRKSERMAKQKLAKEPNDAEADSGEPLETSIAADSLNGCTIDELNENSGSDKIKQSGGTRDLEPLLSSKTHARQASREREDGDDDSEHRGDASESDESSDDEDDENGPVRVGTWATGGSGGRGGVADETQREKEIRLFMFDFGHCDPRRCSAHKMRRLGFIRTLKPRDRFQGIVLSPTGKYSVSRDDRAQIAEHGLAVVDCSWNKTDGVPFKRIAGTSRLLPFMVAANTINYGRPMKLK